MVFRSSTHKLLIQNQEFVVDKKQKSVRVQMLMIEVKPLLQSTFQCQCLHTLIVTRGQQPDLLLDDDEGEVNYKEEGPAGHVTSREIVATGCVQLQEDNHNHQSQLFSCHSVSGRSSGCCRVRKCYVVTIWEAVLCEFLLQTDQTREHNRIRWTLSFWNVKKLLPSVLYRYLYKYSL